MITKLHRTFWSFSLGYLKEIILVDDHSDDSSTKDILPRAIEFLFPPVVKLLRNKKQMGLTKARIVGADYSTGEVLAFLDAHCEVGPGWLEPYLQRIKEDYRNVVLPMFDHINIEKFNIQGSSVLIDAMDFNWGLGHTYSTLSEQKKAMLSESNAKFVPAATMPGCCFGIHRKWWEELGKYDPGFEVWGGENLEISFKIWMCGGKMETSPCSHQAHVYRLWLTKKRTVTNLQYLEANRKRLADVWMDDFKNIVYERHPEMKATNAGDITKRIALRKRLKCHSFDWYLKNVLPNKYIPTTRSKAKDGLQNIAGHCLDTMQQEPPASPKLYPFCHNGTTQRFDHSANNEIRVALDQCLEAKTAEKTVLLLPCSGTDSQKWTHTGPNSSIKALVDEKLCLRYNESDLELDFCDPLDQMQLWKFDNYFEGKTT